MSICLIGNFCIDLIIRGVPHLPAWGQEVAGDDYLLASSGQTTYTAFALRALGDPVAVIGCVGGDAWGSRIRGDLESRGVDAEGLETIACGRTALTVAAVRPDGERAFVSDFACLNHADESVIERGWQKVDRAEIVCLLGIFSWPGLSLARTAALFRRMRQAGKATMLDTGWDPGGWNPDTRTGLRSPAGRDHDLHAEPGRGSGHHGKHRAGRSGPPPGRAGTGTGRGEAGEPGQSRPERGPQSSARRPCPSTSWTRSGPETFSMPASCTPASGASRWSDAFGSAPRPPRATSAAGATASPRPRR